jgi:hypothetical protein
VSDWAVGDLAVCVNNEALPWSSNADYRKLVVGQVYRVSGLRPHPITLGLHVSGIDSVWGLSCDRFRKIRPDEREACEPEFVTLLQRIKRKEVA